jgi:putative spermidine/putrescine transport system ATP-binding protein
VAEFVGLMNRIPGTIEAGGAAVLGRVVPIRNQHGLGSGQAADVLVRPEGLALTPDGDGGHTVVAKTFLGSLTRVSVQLGDALVLVDQTSDSAAALAPGSRVAVTVSAAKVLVAEPRSASA